MLSTLIMTVKSDIPFNLFLDDERVPSDVTWVQLPDVEWKIVRSYNQFVQYIQIHGAPALIAFDMDLGFEDLEDPTENDPETIFTERNGYDCAKWLVGYCLEHHVKLPEYIIHSCNPVQKENAAKYLENAKKHCPELN